MERSTGTEIEEADADRISKALANPAVWEAFDKIVFERQGIPEWESYIAFQQKLREMGLRPDEADAVFVRLRKIINISNG